MPKVALFSTNFLPYSQTFVFEEIRQHQRYEVEVFARRRMLRDRFPFEPVHVAGPLYGYTRACSAFDREFSSGRFELVHAHFGTGAVYAVRWSERYGLPLVITFHGHDVSRLCSRERYFPTTWRYAWLQEHLFEQMTLGLCASIELRDMLVGLGVPASKLYVHRLGIDLGAFQKGQRDADAPAVIMIGNLLPKKGFADGIDAFARVAHAAPTARLTIVGQGKLDAALRSQVRALGLQDRVTFTGGLPPPEVAHLLAHSDVLMAPSFVDDRGHRESGLIVVKEASSSQCVPIGTLHGGIPDIIDDGETGYLVPERDVDQLADRLARLLSNPALRERLGAAARRKMEREYDNGACVRRLEQHYDEAIERHRGARSGAARA